MLLLHCYCEPMAVFASIRLPVVVKDKWSRFGIVQRMPEGGFLMKLKYIFNLTVCFLWMFSVSGVGAASNMMPAVTSAGQISAPVTYIVDPFFSPDWISESDLGAANFGASVASAGDVM